MATVSEKRTGPSDQDGEHHGVVRRRRHPLVTWTRRGLLVLVLGSVLVPVTVAARVWYVAKQDARPPSDVIIVLGAAQYNGDPSEVFAARLAHAAELYHQGVAPRIVTVGASQPGDRYTEAGAAKRWLIERREVSQGDVVAVPEGNNTLTSLEAADRVMERHGWSSAVIVTDPWHSLRSRAMARDLGIEAATSPARDNNPLVGPLGVELRYITRETAAYIYYELFGSTPDVPINLI